MTAVLCDTPACFIGFRHLSRCLELRAGPSPVSQLLKCKKQNKGKESRRALGSPGLVTTAVEPASIPMNWKVGPSAR